jgi:hypothetical protein
VLVTGTVVYGKGDEAEVAEEIAEGQFTDEQLVAPSLPPSGTVGLLALQMHVHNCSTTRRVLHSK